MMNKANVKIATKILILLTLLNVFRVETIFHEKIPGNIYILHWIREDLKHNVHWKLKRKAFTDMHCRFQNCYLTDDRSYFEDLINFDVILINSIYTFKGDFDFPSRRSDDQAYIFVSPESSSNYPIKYGDSFDWFFNYTWTYKLLSDIPYPYLIVRNKTDGKVIAPKKYVQWLDVEDMEPVSADVGNKLKNKNRAVAWFASNCVANSERFKYVFNLRDVLSSFGQDLDIYGACGPFECPYRNMDECLATIESDYYFYIAFENSYSEDYVSEKLLTAVNHFAIPVVLGGADYSRFMPNGSYLDAFKVGEEDLAKKILHIMSDKKLYYSYFKWNRYYSYHEASESADTDPLCALCAFLNGDWRKKRRVYARFAEWWNEMDHQVPQVVKEGTIVYFDDPVDDVRIITTRPKEQLVAQSVAKPSDPLSNTLDAVNSVRTFFDSVVNFVFD